MQNGLLLTSDTDLVRYIGQATAGSDCVLRVRNSAESFVAEVSHRLVDWVAIDFSEDSSARRMLFNRVPRVTNKIAILASDPDQTLQSFTGSNFTVIQRKLPYHQLRTALGITGSYFVPVVSNVSGLVVIADKENSFTARLANDLMTLGFEVLLPKHAVEAVRLVRERHPSSVIIGFNAFSTPGSEICRAIRRIGMKPEPKLYVTTDLVTNEKNVEALAAGAEVLYGYSLDNSDLIGKIITNAQSEADRSD